MPSYFYVKLNKGLSINKQGRILRGFFALDKALKRSHNERIPILLVSGSNLNGIRKDRQ